MCHDVALNPSLRDTPKADCPPRPRVTAQSVVAVINRHHVLATLTKGRHRGRDGALQAAGSTPTSHNGATTRAIRDIAVLRTWSEILTMTCFRTVDQGEWIGSSVPEIARGRFHVMAPTRGAPLIEPREELGYVKLRAG